MVVYTYRVFAPSFSLHPFLGHHTYILHTNMDTNLADRGTQSTPVITMEYVL